MIKYLGQTGLEHLISKIKAALNGKVSTAAGMGLSHNDFTDAYLQKLNGIAAGANNYTLPTASGSVKGGIRIGSNLSMSGEVLSATNTTYGNATTGAAGLMSAADKQKLNGIAAGANAYSLPTASGGTKGGIKVGSNLSMSGETLNATDTRYGNATTSAAGLMSAADKQKLNGITGTGSYVLPPASASTLGGIKTGFGVEMDTQNRLNARFAYAFNSRTDLRYTKSGDARGYGCSITLEQYAGFENNGSGLPMVLYVTGIVHFRGPDNQKTHVGTCGLEAGYLDDNDVFVNDTEGQPSGTTAANAARSLLPGNRWSQLTCGQIFVFSGAQLNRRNEVRVYLADTEPPLDYHSWISAIRLM